MIFDWATDWQANERMREKETVWRIQNGTIGTQNEAIFVTRPYIDNDHYIDLGFFSLL